MTATALIVPTIDAAVSIHVSAIAQKASSLESAKAVTKVSGPFERTMCVSAMTESKAFLDLVEESRVAVKRPYLDMGSEIDRTAADLKRDVLDQYKRMNRLLDAYQDELDRIAREAEEKRQAELRRIENERRQAEAEAALKLAAEREEADKAAELKRVNSLRLAVTYDEKRAAETNAELERKRIEAESIARSEQRQREINEAAAKSTRQVILSAPVVVPKPEGMSVRRVWDFEVVDIDKLYRARPELCNVIDRRSDILAVIRQGTREIDGLRIYETTSTGVRA